MEQFSLDAFSLAGRVAVVTGGNGGLGRAFTLALAAAGADVLVPTVADDGGETRALVEARGASYDELTIDLTAPGAPRQVVERCLATYGRLDVLVNSAGISLIGDVESFGRARWDAMVALNLTAAFELSQECVPTMRAQGGGKIINVASLFSVLGGRGSPAYAATKHGIAGLTKAYADELAADGICVNAIAPGYMATPMTAARRADPAASQVVVDHVPAGRWGEPEDLMGAVVFLASRASDYVHGHVLAVDGGYLVR
ncbi:SDR family oxidoreductase [Nocardioides sp. CFH 31398]|uniref:SDR family oxidoreductase n=1 Tax=Nocardioides sp. CFH 31398 TaxID=2919579 RepID=UPI001F057098|nr:SDR family oxidoreductase [Nocardioides sp. CFH 31398]MCH1866058.1 SDR family oxidoreductase [Nocardioides sp. CFH 31398]